METNKKSHFDHSRPTEFNVDERYKMAYKRVKRIKGFYVHLMVYVLVNAFLILGNYYRDNNENINFRSWETFNVVFFWGIGLVAHGLSVFGRNLFFSSKWEQSKIEELMNKEKNHKWE